MQRWLGIDFSGNHLMWRAGCTTSNVWIADVRAQGEGLGLHDVRRVQHLAGNEAPFDRLVALLASATYLAAGIDAPFSLPQTYVRALGGHDALLHLVGRQRLVGRPFIKGIDLVRLVAGGTEPLRPPKPMRAVDTFWVKRGVNTRSPMWTGARPGAPMTAACLTLLQRANRPLWPWSDGAPGLLAEAFPAAQLKTWGLPYEKYDGSSRAAVATRAVILESLATRVRLGRWRTTLLGSADALDAVVCAFGARAVTTSSVVGLGEARDPKAREGLEETEGWVAVQA